MSELTSAERERLRTEMTGDYWPWITREMILVLLDAADERDRRARDITQDDANELQDILRTMTAGGTTLKTSARELVERWKTLTAKVTAQAATIEGLCNTLTDAMRSITVNDADMGDDEPRLIVQQITAAIAAARKETT